MVKYLERNLNLTFKALGHSTRRAILQRLAAGECSVGELAEPFDISLPAVSKHLRVLERAGLVQRERDGRVRRMHIDAAPIREVADWVDHYRDFWEDRLDSLSRFLQADETDPPDETRDTPEDTDAPNS